MVNQLDGTCACVSPCGHGPLSLLSIVPCAYQVLSRYMPAVLDQNSKLARNPKGMKGLMDPSFLNFSGDDEVETMLNSFKVRRKCHVPYLQGERGGAEEWNGGSP